MDDSEAKLSVAMAESMENRERIEDLTAEIVKINQSEIDLKKRFVFTLRMHIWTLFSIYW